MSEDRLMDIETKLAFQEHTIDELNSVVIEQQREIDRLKNAVEFLLDKVSQIADTRMERAPSNEKPPHY
ncbi:SlyX family protein [Desulfoluna butyratoxydans]|uniref:Slyx n=1 Tax=Desulfoluna butyratoxydans TaxID=231438 RepID=A0A4U8YR93_9BACT|nr:SlyX family protein [Desulfoluna butyratoxydans]VFQ45987.1 slyx [Desulfoluna butyratoxydans]